MQSKLNFMEIIQSSKKNVDVTLLVTFHREGILAYSTLNSLERCREYAEKAGITTEYVWILGSCNEETKAVVMSHPAKSGNVQIIEVDQDLGESRNSGISIANGTAIAVLDGDDYYSTNWIERAWHCLKEYGDNSIIHPEFVVCFGSHSAYCRQTDQDYNNSSLLMGNCWTSWSFALRSTYQCYPYAKTSPLQTGFGYEDWHWNCEMIAYNYTHRLAPKTVGFYRRKVSSLVTTTTGTNAIIPPSRLFSKTSCSAEEK
jgi:glycosyltransferase involved in cell wall biosynthesis